jgi:transposase
VRRATNSEETLQAITRDLGISLPTLRRWIADSRAAPDVPLSDDERTELKRLRREVRELKLEREILKKATAFFAKQSE